MLCLDMKYPIIANVFFSRTEPLDTAKTCHKGPHEHNQDLNLLAPQIKLKAKKKKKKVLQSLILGARFSSHSPDIFEDSL